MTVAQIPSHNHGIYAEYGAAASTVLQPSNTTSKHMQIAGPQASSRVLINSPAIVPNTGSGGAHNNLQPYITCYMWKRTQ